MLKLGNERLRDRQALRDAVDAKLGRGSHLTPGQAWDALSNLERVEWILGEFWFGIQGHNFHLWIQGQAQRDLDGPRWVAAIGRAAESIDPEIGQLVRWTAERGRAVRAEERGEALISIATSVWEPVLDRAAEVLKNVVERWPEDLELADLEAGDPPVRPIVAPAQDGCRYPGCAVGFTAHATDACSVVAAHPQDARSTVMFALWRHGASEEEIERFDQEMPSGDAELPEALARWVDFDGAGPEVPDAQLDELRRALDPVAQILGVETTDGMQLHRVKMGDFERLAEELKPYGAIRVAPDDEAGFKVRMTSALRMDASMLLVDSFDLQADEEVTLVLHAIWTGSVVILGGNAPGAVKLLQEIEKHRPA